VAVPPLLLGPFARAIWRELPELAAAPLSWDRRIGCWLGGSRGAREESLPPRTISFGLGERFLRGIAPPRLPRQKGERPGKGRSVGGRENGAPTFSNRAVTNCAHCA